MFQALAAYHKQSYVRIYDITMIDFITGPGAIRVVVVFEIKKCISHPTSAADVHTCKYTTLSILDFIYVYLTFTISQGESPITMLREVPMSRLEPCRVTGVPPDSGPMVGVTAGLSSRGDCVCVCVCVCVIAFEQH